MPRHVRIVTSSLATFEAVNPPFNLRQPAIEENLSLAQSILETAAAFKPDLVLLPETFKTAGWPGSEIKANAEPVPGPTFNMISKCARDGHYNLVAGHLVAEGDRIFNKALVIDRQGELVGSYSKNYPVENEIGCGVTPGTDAPAFDLDFGRIGALVCFDINWPSLWSALSQKKVDLACWISAYEGGFPLRSYAWTYQYPIVTSVMPYHARVIDITGEILCSTSRWSRVVFYDLNLDRELFHTDKQMQKIAEIQKKYGDDVVVKTLTEEHLILVENNLPGKTVTDIAQEFGLVTYKDYIRECTHYRDDYVDAAKI